MKTNIFQKGLRALCALLLCATLAQANVINVPVAGTLTTVLSQEQKDTISVLKLTGFLDSNTNGDYRVLRDMPNLQYLDLSEVTITNNRIPENAFYGKTTLKSVILPDELVTIRYQAFRGCSALSQINFPANLQTIEYTAFYQCTSLKQAAFPASLKTIANDVFNACSSLTQVTFSDGIESIGYQAFRDCSALERISFPASLLTIGYTAFYNCTSLVQATFSSGLKIIEYDAFRNCTALTHVTFTEGLETIRYRAFQDCAALNQVSFPQSLRTIEYEAFRYCGALTQASFAEGLQSIGSYAFQNCSKWAGQLQLPSTLASIGYATFNGCNKLTSCKISAETPPVLDNDNSLGNLNVVYVPEAAKTNYKNANYWKNKIIITDGQPVSLTLNITTPGTLGEKVLEQVTHSADVNILKLIGTLNSTDFTYIRNDLVSLISVDFLELTNTELPNDLFRDRKGLLSIQLPAGLKKIGTYCFYNCYALTAPEFPATLEEISNGAFYNCYNIYSLNLPNALSRIGSEAFRNCINLTSVAFPSSSLKTIDSYAFAYCYLLGEALIPESVTAIGSYAFYQNYALKKVSLPDNLTVIDNGTFEECSLLASINLPSKLTEIGSYAFKYCSLFTQFNLPASLTKVNYQTFYNCTNLQQIICLSAVPPVANSSNTFDGVNKSTCELIVPAWATSAYKLADGWKEFTNINPYGEAMENIFISSPLAIAGNARPLGVPNVEIAAPGSLSVIGNATFSANQFVLKPQLRAMYYSGYYYSPLSSYAQVISECNSMTAQHVKFDMTAYGNHWYYVSFPFDVAMTDISIDPDAYFVFRYYDGDARATTGVGGSWKNVNSTDILQAGKGYIFQCSKDVEHLILPATDASKNRLFASTAQSVALIDYPSAMPANQGWNLAGNPYACYYDIRCMDYTAPITYWNDYYGNYEAVSPVDDAFLLQPYQAFFVQKPNDLSAITFQVAGRQNTTTPVQRVSPLRSSTQRTLINLGISNDRDLADKTRVVLNSGAGLDYEIAHDAAKFMSTSPETPQLYSIDASEVHYAINERPLDNGVVALGVYAGTAGSHTVTLQSPVEGFEILLIDKDLNKTVDLTAEEYTFSSEAGTFDKRFELKIGKASGSLTPVITPENSKANVYASKGAIVLENVTGQVSVYTVNGAQTATVRATGAKTVLPMPQGVYIVKIDGKVFKTVVF